MNRYKSSADAHLIPYHVSRGDALLQDEITKPETIRRGLDMLAEKGGDLAYTPEMLHRFETVLMRRFETHDGGDNFQMPHYGVYDDPEMAAFYGCDTSKIDNIRSEKETFKEVVDRLLFETVREIESEMAGLSQMMQHYRNEEWARYGVAAEAPYSHVDPDVTLFRNPSHGWSTMDRPAATSQKSNVIDLYEAQGEHIFATPHEGWEVDKRGMFYDREGGGETAYGF